MCEKKEFTIKGMSENDRKKVSSSPSIYADNRNIIFFLG